ncbi:MAG: hypothetical protein GY841_02775 [FCB group bacterium]|nr:hypothetical protein [FCB group bacterium]
MMTEKERQFKLTGRSYSDRVGNVYQRGDVVTTTDNLTSMFPGYFAEVVEESEPIVEIESVESAEEVKDDAQEPVVELIQEAIPEVEAPVKKRRGRPRKK